VPQQHQLLLALKGLPKDAEPTVGRLAERLQVRHHSVVELVDRLARRGLVERRRDRHDKRKVFVDLTPAGEDVLRKLSIEHRRELRAAGPALLKALSETGD
jgi:DNA-binding MarR family transcriptional regulator